jgi:Rrf2 family protein
MQTALRISEAASLALHSMALLASDSGTLQPARKVAEALRVSEAHLAKVMQRLQKQGFVESVRGPKGGFRLASGARDLTLLEILEAVDGPFEPSGCLLGRALCGGRRCIMGGLLETVNETVRAYLAGTRLGEVGASLPFMSQEGE